MAQIPAIRDAIVAELQDVFKDLLKEQNARIDALEKRLSTLEKPVDTTASTNTRSAK